MHWLGNIIGNKKKHKRKRGATRLPIENKNFLLKSEFSKKHFLLFGGFVVGIAGIIGLLPAPQVEAKRTTLSENNEQLHYREKEILDLVDQNIILKEMNEHVSSPSKYIMNEHLIQINEEPELKNQEHLITVQPGDNLSTLLQKYNLGAALVHQLTKTPIWGRELSDLRPKETLILTLNANGTFHSLAYKVSNLEKVIFEKQKNTIKAKHTVYKPTIKTAYTSGIIEDSLFLACQKAGLKDQIIMELVGIFSWDIDFVQDIRTGDRFSLLYEEEYLNGERLGYGKIIAATFSNRGKTHTAIHHTDSQGNGDYYTPEGASLRKAFLRTPVDFTRISSKFNPNRIHPIFKTKKPHQGVDYAAPMNTPIKATGAGKVIFAGWNRGYGNFVRIKHPGNIITVYAHQNKIHSNIKIGNYIKQGDIIGYVGQTGWATGPHLHYEFLVNGKHHDPITVELPDASPVPKNNIAEYKKHVKHTLAQLEQVSGTMVAQSDN